MKTVRWFGAVVLATAGATTSPAQDFPKPGPEHELLQKMAGTWDTTMKFGGMESKGIVVYKMDLGGLWLAGTLESDLGGMKYSGRSFDTYDAGKKKYVGVWIDSMGTQPMILEGTFDKAKNARTMIGTAPGLDGKPTTYRAVSVMPDNDTINFSMYMGDGKDPAFTIVYKRKK